jgi:hypothetical protein
LSHIDTPERRADPVVPDSEKFERIEHLMREQEAAFERYQAALPDPPPPRTRRGRWPAALRLANKERRHCDSAALSHTARPHTACRRRRHANRCRI